VVLYLEDGWEASGQCVWPDGPKSRAKYVYTATSTACRALDIAETFRPYRIGLLPVVGYCHAEPWPPVSPMHGWETRGPCEWPAGPWPPWALQNGF
jgi:hypothetical protein